MFEFTALRASLFEQVAKTLDALTIGGRESLTEQSVHRLFEVAVLHEVVGEHSKHLFDVEIVEVVVFTEATKSVTNGH